MRECVKVLRPGLLSTVQDLGRFGAMAWGVPHSGAADDTSIRVANLLAGNPVEAAALETTLGGLELEFLEPAAFSVTGALGQVFLDEVRIPMNSAVRANRGSKLRLGAPDLGVRQYIAFRGGLDAPVILGSRSTYIKGALGGFEGRALKRGDVLGILPDDACGKRGAIIKGFTNPSLEKDYEGRCVLRVTPGTMDSKFADGEIGRMLDAEYEVSQESDRMGIRLKGYSVKHSNGADILSGGIEPGAVQVPGSGEPIILMADRQTTGGYTKAFSVISADRPKLGQLRPSDKVRFSMIGLDEAHEAYENLERMISSCVSTQRESIKTRLLRIKIGDRTFDAEVEELT